MLVISVFVGKNVSQVAEEHKNSVFQILKIGKAFSHFDFNSTIGKKINFVVQLFGNKVI